MIYEKLFHIQDEIQNLSKNAKNPHFKNTYADLNRTLEELKPIYQEHGVVIEQGFFTESHFQPGMVGVYTRLVDVDEMKSEDTGPVWSGRGYGWVESKLTLSADPTDPQKQAAAITYARRYLLQTMAVIGADDDDGEKASGKKSKPAVSKPAGSKPIKQPVPIEPQAPEERESTIPSSEGMYLAASLVEQSAAMLPHLPDQAKKMYGSQIKNQLAAGAFEMVVLTFKSIEKEYKKVTDGQNN